VTAKEGLFCHLSDELVARNLGQDRPVICLMDGERALWGAQAVYLGKTQQRYVKFRGLGLKPRSLHDPSTRRPYSRNSPLGPT